MSYQRLTLVERMDIFELLYVERLKPSAIAVALNRKPSTITREIAKGMDNRMYNFVIAETGHLEARRNQRPCFKMTDEARSAWKLGTLLVRPVPLMGGVVIL